MLAKSKPTQSITDRMDDGSYEIKQYDYYKR